MSFISAPAGQRKTSCSSYLTHDSTSEHADQNQDTPLTYQQALDGLRNDGSLLDPEVTSLLDELVTKEESYGENNIFVAYVLKRIVQRCNFIGKHEEAEKFGKRALEIFEAVGGEDHLIVAEQLKGLGCSCQSQEKYDEAETYYWRAIAIFETKLSPYDLEIAGAKLSLGWCYFQQDKFKEAEVLYKQALEIYKLRLGPDHGLVTSSKALLDSCKKGAERFEKMKQSTTHKRKSDAIDAIDADDKPTNSQGYVAAKKAKVVKSKVDPCPTSSAALAMASTPIPSSSSDEAEPRESRSLRQVVADARTKIMAEVDRQLSDDRIIMEVDENLHWNLNKRVEELQAKNADQNVELCQASRKIEDLMCSQSTYERLIAELRTELDEKDEQLSSSEEKIKNLEGSLDKSTRLEAEISDQAQRLLEAKATIETSERTIAELKAEIAEKSRQLAEAKRTIESRLFCSICVEKDANRMWTECRHVATREQCAMDLLRRDMGNSGNGVACPKCRTPGFPTKVFI